ncbi:MAG TPA: hypothetical protein VJU61_25160 [Polyangiaceae bacterium]|nr:hypothetical protein [Polyangiaceae bacterium]
MRAVVLALSAQLALACAEQAAQAPRFAPLPAPRSVAPAENLEPAPAPVASAEAEAPAPALPPVSYAEATALAKQHCAECHQGSVSQAKPAALSVFDLDQGAWSAGLSAEQFQVFYQRMQGELDPPTRVRVLAFTESEAARVAARRADGDL